MKVLLINGSPHKEGSTYTALRQAADVLEQEGIETEIFHIGSKPVGGCVVCGSCSKNGNGRCAFDDTVNEAAAKAEEADGFIFGSPVYYASPNGSMMAFMDRLFFANGKAFAYKPAACVTAARRAGTSASLDALMKYPMIFNMPVVSSQYWNMVHGSCGEDVKKDEEGMQTMRGIGRNMAWLLKCIQKGKESGISHPETEPKIKTNFIR